MGLAHLILLGLIISLTRQGGDFIYRYAGDCIVVKEVGFSFGDLTPSEQAGRRPGE